MACPGRTRSTRLGRRPHRGGRAIWEPGACAGSTARSSSPASRPMPGWLGGLGMEPDGAARPYRRLVDRDRPWPVPVHESRDDRRCQLVVTVRDLHDRRRSCRHRGAPPVRGLAAATYGSERLAARPGCRAGSGGPAPSTTTPTRMAFHGSTGRTSRLLPRIGRDTCGSASAGPADWCVIRMGASCASPRLTAYRPGASTNLLLDSKGRMWAATDRSGVSRIDAPDTERPTFVGTPRHRGCPAITRAPWLKTSGGASTSGPAAASTGSIRQAARSDTTPAPTGSRPALVRGARPSRRAVVQHDRRRPAPGTPDRMRPSALHPFSSPASTSAGRPRPLSAIGEPEMRLTEPSSRNTHLQIDFVSLGFSHGEQLRYQYMLEGAENAWSPPSTLRTVNYASLAPGTYRFACAPSTPTRMASDTPASVSFTVLPPIWGRWWFIMLVGDGPDGRCRTCCTARA